MALGLLALFAPLPTRALDITINGTKVGFSRLTPAADGFEVESRIELGTTVIASGVVRRGDTYTVTIPGAEGKPATVGVWAKGRLKVSQDGKELADRAIKPTLPFGNIAPMLGEPTFAKVDWGRREAQKFDVFLVDGLAPLSITITPQAPRGELRYARVSLGTVEATYVLKADGVVAVDVPSQKLRFLTPGLANPFVDPLAKYPELSQSRYVPVTERGVTMTVRDGTALVADVVRPAGEGKYPVILTRTPYGRLASSLEGEFWARRGYVFVAQDCRGRGDSGGAWDPFVNEAKDGYDAVEWAAKLPNADGSVGMIGGSYGGLVQWSAASLRPPHLKCIVPQVSPPGDGMRNLPYEYGVFTLSADLWWSRVVADKNADMTKVRTMADMKPAGFATLPLADVPKAVLGRDIPFWNDWLRRETLTDWKGWNYTDRLGDAPIPALHISGWWDGDGIGTQLNWQTRRAAGIKNDWLLIGPWTHAFNTTSRFLDEKYGDSAILELDSLYLRWFDTWLKEREVGMEKIARARIFVKGENRWIAASDWPLPTSAPARLFFGPSSTLREKPGTGTPSWTYDPVADGTKAMAPITMEPPSLAVDPVEKPSLVFTSAPMAEATLVTGQFAVTLRLKCSTVDTDVHAFLFRETVAGRRIAMGVPGVVRASYRDGLRRRVALPKDGYVTMTVRPWDTAHRLLKGERLGVYLLPTRFPQTARNLGTMDPILTAKRAVKQKVTFDLSGCSLSYYREPAPEK